MYVYCFKLSKFVKLINTVFRSCPFEVISRVSAPVTLPFGCESVNDHALIVLEGFLKQA